MARLEALFMQEYGPLVRALSVVADDAELAEEAVEDAFVQAVRHGARVVGYDNPAAWVRRVALNRLSDRRRARGGWLRFLSRQRTSGSLSDNPDGESSVAGPLELREALKQLPEKQREAAVLRYVAGYSVIETSEAMNVSEGTAKQHLSRARSALRAAMKE